MNRLTKQQYAAKVISKKRLSQDINNIKTLKNEIKVLRNLTNTPHTLKLYEVHETGGSIYLLSPYFSGGEILDFDDESERPLTNLEEARAILFSILKTIWNINKLGIVHRDVKPENIMIENSTESLKQKKIISVEEEELFNKEDVLCGYEEELFEFYEQNLKIIDFGISTTKDSKFINPYCGTPGFMAPELFNDYDLDHFKKNILTNKIDVYSIGAIFFYLQFGEYPFSIEKVENMIEKNTRNSFKKLKLKNQVFEKKNPEAYELLMGMLETDFEKRLSVEDCINHEFFRKYPKKFLNECDGKSGKKFMDQMFEQSPTDVVERVGEKKTCNLRRFVR